MNDVPQSGTERDAYAIKVMQGVERDAEGHATNLQIADRRGNEWDKSPGFWDWSLFDYRIMDPKVVMWAYGYADGRISKFFSKKRDIYDNHSVVDVTHYIKRTTGGGRTIPQYEAVPLEDK